MTDNSATHDDRHGITAEPTSLNSRSPAVRNHAGRKVVLAMFGMGIAATAVLWTYWYLHLIPFMPLQKALVAEFPNSSPRVDGGQRKMHQGSVSKLRAVMRVDFDPTINNQETADRANHLMQRFRELAREHANPDDFQMLELHLYFPVKEREIREAIFRRNVATLEPVDIDGRPLQAQSAPLPDTEGPTEGRTDN